MRIIIVEDNKDSRNLLLRQLSTYGHEVIPTADGIEALKQALAQPPDVIISDIMMPHMDGYQLCRECKQNAKLKDIPFIFYTATYLSAEDEKFALRLGAVAFLRKPSEPDSLAQVLSEIVKNTKPAFSDTHEISTFESSLFLTEYTKRIVSKLEDKVSQLTAEIAERKRIEETLRQYENIVSSSPDMLALLDKEFTYLAANKAYTEAFNFPHEQIIGSTVADLFGEEFFHTVIKPHADRCLRGEEVNYQAWLDLAVCGKCCMDINYYPYYSENKEIMGFVVNARNITERKKSEEKLRANEQELTMLLEYLPGIVFYKDINYKYRRVNRAFTQMYNTTQEEILGKAIKEVSLPGAELADSDDHDVMENGCAVTRTIEFPDVKSISRWQQITKVPIKDEEGKPRGILGVGVDISDILKAQEELQLRAEMLDQAMSGIILSDLNGDFLYANDMALKERGHSRKNFLKMNVRNIAIPPDGKDVDVWWHQVLEKGYFRGEFEVVRSNNRKVPVEATLTKIRVGGKEYIISVSQNITERKKYEEELRLRVEMLNQAKDGILLHDLDGNFIYVNDTVVKQRGYSREEFMRMNVLNMLSAEYYKRQKEWWKKLKIGEYQRSEFEVRCKDGTLIPMEANITKVYYGGKDFILSITRDITERKRTEEELKLRAEMLNQARDGIMLRDFDGNLLYANETAVKERGYTLKEIFKLNARDLVVAEPGAGKIEEWWQEILEQGYRHTEYTVQCKDGSVVPMDVMATKIKSGDKEYILSVTRNITKQKHMEVARKELERKAQVASRLASVGEMASGIAHEINNPLTGVVGFAQLLAERKDLPEDIREELKIIHEGGQRVSNIVKGLLSFARQSKPRREYININEVVEGTLRLSNYKLKTGNIEVIRQFDPELPWTMADAGQLQQVFINLVVNAQHEMRKAHGRGRLEIKTELVDNMIHISFKDDGPGIAKEHIERIFDPFFTTKEAGKGTGLGLSLSHGIIAEHGGQLYTESEPGNGATFVVELPVLAEEADVEETKVANETGKVIKGRILVVDDEEVVRQYLSSVLTRMGHTVDLATDGQEALELVKSNRYNLILSDMKMPGMDGKEFYQRIGGIAPSLTGRLAFITGDVMGEETRGFIQKTGALYLTKPFNAERLNEVVNSILSGSKK